MKFKFIDDLSFLEKLNLLLAGIISYNFRNHVASNVGIHQSFIPNQNLQTQEYINKIQNCTDQKKCKLNVSKSNIMIFNFKDTQFTTRLYMENTLLEVITDTKLLGTIVTSDLKWSKNTESLVKRAYSHMQILHKLNSFHVDWQDLKVIYILYIRSVLDQNGLVWCFSRPEDYKLSLERV